MQNRRAPVVLQKKTFHSCLAIAVYSVQLPGEREVFMRVERKDYGNDRRGVVVVDAERFLALIPRAPIDDSHWFHQPDFRKDYKFGKAEVGFSCGEANPVPLAEVSYELYRGGYGVAFTNGITRTLWLLANHAVAFPVECPASQAGDLYDAAGLQGIEPITVHSLLHDLRWEDYLDPETPTTSAIKM